ncbi:MAG: hypothetical protein R6W93_00705 [Candidatus Limnocylindrales bacterium]
MRKLAALSGALLLMMVLAAPAAAAQKVTILEEPFTFPPDGGVAVDLSNDIWTNPEFFGNDWACRDKVIYYQIIGKESLRLWYPNGVDTTDPDEYMPVGEAWPWTKGEYANSGTDYFAANEAMTNKVISGKYAWKSHVYDHVVDNPESWKERVTGKYWGINIPGYGTVIHVSGINRGEIRQVIDPSTGDITDFMYTDLGFRGNSTFDYDELCDYYDAGPAVFLQ